MAQEKKIFPVEKKQLHARNAHRQRYDFPRLMQANPELKPFVTLNKFDELSIDFADPAAVRALNKALLKQHYGIQYWDIPANYLCPPIPGRADYIHYLADLLAESNQGEIPQGKSMVVLDIGVGTNCIYPIIGQAEYGWRFVGTDIDPVAIATAKLIVQANPALSKAVTLRQQSDPEAIFTGAITKTDRFALTLCNPPFHSSAQEAEASTRRKLNNLGLMEKTSAAAPVLNFGGQSSELWCEGGEEAFICRMARQSQQYGEQCLWFTSLVSKQTTLPAVYRTLKQVGARQVKTINMAQGQKTSRIVAWTFIDEEQREAWLRRCQK